MTDPRIPRREDCLVSELIDRRAREIGSQLAVKFDRSTEWTYDELRDRVRSCAAGLQALGVRQGDFVLSWLPNGPQSLTLWYALNYIGAIYVPINTAYRGTLLEHVIDNSDASLIVADSRLVEHLSAVGLARLSRIVVVGEQDAVQVPASLELFGQEALDGNPALVEHPASPIEPWHTMMIIYTSGTTGPSKGVLISYVQAYSASRAHHWVGADDRALVTLPLFHIGGTWPSYRGMVTGGSIAMVAGFSTGTFWQSVRETGVTNVTLVSAMVSFLLRQPGSPDDRSSGLRSVSIVPINAEAIEFGRRFGVDVYTSFGMSEISAPITYGPNPTVIGSCGTPRKGVQARIVDENDCEVPIGQTGELILRSDVPWAFNHGYHKNPEGTSRAWRNGWFHTGDAFRRDAEGNYFYVDRIKDAIRRRGENISAFEVEREIMQHNGVADVAVVGVRSEHGEDDVLAVVVRKPGERISEEELFAFVQPRMAHFMLPRYIRFIDALPRTHTHRVQKYLLREITEDTWDRVAAGIEIRREKLV